jgi:hypothetical protein
MRQQTVMKWHKHLTTNKIGGREMENLTCPNCLKDFGVKYGMTGIDVKSCASCGDAFTVMYVAGFTDGRRATKQSGAVTNGPTKAAATPLCRGCGAIIDNIYCDDCRRRLSS